MRNVEGKGCSRFKGTLRKMHEDDDIKYEVGVGLLPSKDDQVYHLGHFWLRWPNPFTGEISYRGYWPILDDLPADINDDEIRDFVCRESVRGMYKIDSFGMRVENEDVPHRSRLWPFSEDSFYRLVFLHCNLPDGVKFRISGFYSCNENIENSHNCSSWAIHALRSSRLEPGFLPCSRPKRLKYVERDIWGVNGNDKTEKIIE